MHFNIQKCLMSASGILGIALAGLVIGDDAPAPTQVVPGFDHRIRLLSFSSDGKALLIGNPGPAVNIWDPQMGALKDTVRIHEHVVHRIAASPDANVLASAGWDDREGKQRTVKIWDAPKGTLRHTIREETNVLLFSPDGKRLATNHGFAAIRIWDVETGKLHRELKAFQSTATVLSFSVMALAFSKDGKLLAAGSGQPFINGARLPPAEVRLWDMETGKLRHAQGGFSVVHSLAIAPDSTWLAIGVTMIVEGSSKRRLIIYDIRKGFEIKHELEMPLIKDEPTSLAFSPDGKTLAVAAGRVKLINPETGNLKVELDDKSGRPATAVAFSPDGTLLASGGDDLAVKLWNVSRILK